jgi:hypothetical protein
MNEMIEKMDEMIDQLRTVRVEHLKSAVESLEFMLDDIAYNEKESGNWTSDQVKSRLQQSLDTLRASIATTSTESDLSLPTNGPTITMPLSMESVVFNPSSSLTNLEFAPGISDLANKVAGFYQYFGQVQTVNDSVTIPNSKGIELMDILKEVLDEFEEMTEVYEMLEREGGW